MKITPEIPLALPTQGFTTGLLAPPYAQIGTQLLTASRTYVVRFLCHSSQRITKMSFVTTNAATNNDNCDVGIFSADGTTLLGSAGSTAGKLNATAGVQTVNLTGSVSLVAGTVYYAAFACGTVGGTAATVAAAGFGTANALDIMGATLPNKLAAIQAAFPLAAPFTAGANVGNVVLLGLLQ